MPDYHIEMTRGNWQETLVVRGDIVRWLYDRKAKPTKDANRFVIAGWRTIITRLDDAAMLMMQRIFGRDYGEGMSDG